MSKNFLKSCLIKIRERRIKGSASKSSEYPTDAKKPVFLSYVKEFLGHVKGLLFAGAMLLAVQITKAQAISNMEGQKATDVTILAAGSYHTI